MQLRRKIASLEKQRCSSNSWAEVAGLLGVGAFRRGIRLLMGLLWPASVR